MSKDARRPAKPPHPAPPRREGDATPFVPVHFTLVHVLKRQMRLVAPNLRRDTERCYVLEILLRKFPGITKVQSVAALGSVRVHFDPQVIACDALLVRIDAVLGNLGSLSAGGASTGTVSPPGAATATAATADHDSEPRHLSLAVEGMSCASCALLIELALNRDPRVAQASVNFAAATLRVSGSIDRDTVTALLARLGYRTRPMDTLAQRHQIIEAERQRLIAARQRVLLAGLLSLPVMVIGMMMPRSRWLRALEFAFATPVVLGAGRPFFAKAKALAAQRSANMDSLIALGAGAAYGYSLPAWLTGRRHLYFEAAAGIITFVLLGRYLEERAKGRAGDAIRRLIDLQPATACRLTPGGEERVLVEDLALGDELMVRPGERIPTDGDVRAGLSMIDESMLTGESLPVIRQEGDTVFGGCINGNGTLRIRVTALGTDTVLAGIVQRVEEAQATKLPVQRLADRVSAVFVPAVLGMSGVTLAGWIMAGAPWSRALAHAIAVLLIACPCALGLATPTAVMAGSGAAARRGVFIRGGDSLETASRLDTLIFDKTGTVTEGRPTVAAFEVLPGFERAAVLALVASAEHHSEHGLGRALGDYARAHGARPGEATQFEAVPGRGVVALVDGCRIHIGNHALLTQAGIPIEGLERLAQARAEAGRTPVFIALDGKAAALAAVADAPRPEAAAVIRRLKGMGIRLLMVTGDVPAVAHHVAAQVGIRDVVAGASPTDKADVVARLRADGAVVGMVGDGINDAPALAAADVGFAVGTGAAIAVEAAPIALASGDIGKVAETILLSRRTMTIIRQNLVWALGYNTVAIPLAAAGRLTPMIASLAMALSSVSVVSNSLRLQQQQARPKREGAQG